MLRIPLRCLHQPASCELRERQSCGHHLRPGDRHARGAGACSARVQACAQSHGKIGLTRPIEADPAEIQVKGVTPEAVRAYLAGLEQAGTFEIEELRRTPAELKVRQIWSLMSSADVLEDHAEREASVAEVRDRWRRIRQAFP